MRSAWSISFMRDQYAGSNGHAGRTWGKKCSDLEASVSTRTGSGARKVLFRNPEIEGMNLSLDETLGNANPHYTRIAREKIAAQEAARKAMEARRVAMIEASWCRILGAARLVYSSRSYINMQDHTKAFEAARAMGVMMYDRPDRQRRQWEVETSLAIGGGRSTHRVTASFETAFEVDKEVAAAVKRAFIRLADCPSSSNKEEFKDLLCKISQNPDTNGSIEDLPEKFSDCETDPGAEPEQESHISRDTVKQHATRTKQRKQKNSLLPTDGGGSSSSTSPTKLIDSMLDRLKGLHEDELASLAVIVATRGLNAALRETESSKENDVEPISSCTSTLKKEALAQVPSLDKFLVKHVSRLEREVQEARRSNAEIDKQRTSDTRVVESKISNKNETQAAESSLDSGSDLVKHVSELGEGILRSKRNNSQVKDGRTAELNVEAESQTGSMTVKSDAIAPSSDNTPSLEELSELSHNKVCKQSSSSNRLTEDVVHLDLMVMREEEVQRPPSDSRGGGGKENIDLVPVSEMHKAGKRMSRVERAKVEVLKAFSGQERNRGGGDTLETMGLDKILVKPIHRLEKEKMRGLEQRRDEFVPRDHKKLGTDVDAPESLDMILVKHVSRLEKEKLTVAADEGTRSVKRNNQQPRESVQSLDEILVKHQSKLEKAKLAATRQPADYIKHEARREARERELQEAWGGLSLGNSLRPHTSRIERDKVSQHRIPL
ncbi:hypothetical protein BHM03_00025519 [Ensete ventricosum]|nr:hypothetical protein BHM03_00025519 [Ensete ventricosum]